jgi:hypothetical protein
MDPTVQSQPQTISLEQNDGQAPLEDSPALQASSPAPSDDKKQLKSLLAEARGTRDMLVGFRAAVESGTFHGSKMYDVAKGLSFVDAILNQNQAHIKNLQERLDA